MSNGSIRGLNLYSFYAILLPGIAFLLLLVPLLPADIEFDILVALIPIAAAGFILGQAVHTLAVIVQSVSDIDRTSTSHRELFTALLQDEELIFETDIPDELVERFTKAVNASYRSELCGSPDQSKEAPPLSDTPEVPWVQMSIPMLSTDSDLNQSRVRTVYTLVRGRIHMDGNGRSRVFQSTYAFCRSVFVGLPIVWVIYVLYAVSNTINLGQMVTDVLGIQSDQSIFYQPIIATIVDEPTGVIFIASFTILPLMFLFSEAMEQYKQYYVEYTMADFILIAESSEDSL